MQQINTQCSEVGGCLTYATSAAITVLVTRRVKNFIHKSLINMVYQVLLFEHFCF